MTNMSDRLMSEGSDPTIDEAGTAFFPPEATPATPSDLFTWAAGFEKPKRSVTLYRRLDLQARRDELAEQLDLARSTMDAEWEARTLEQIREVTAEMYDSRVIVTVQKTTESWRREFVEKLDKQGITDLYEVSIRLLAEHVIEPAGMTWEVLDVIGQADDSQIGLLLTRVNEMNDAVPNLRLTTPF